MSTLSFRNVTIDPQSVAVWKGLQGVTLIEEGGGFEPPIVPSAPPASCLWIWMHCLSSCSSTMPTAAVFPPWWMMGPIPLELEAPTRCFLSQVALVTRQNNQHTLIIGLVIWWFNSCIMLESRYLWRFITLLSEKPKLADCSFSLLPTTLSLRQCVVSVCESNKPSHHKGTKKERHFVWSWVKRELYFKASKNLNNCDHSLCLSVLCCLCPFLLTLPQGHFSHFSSDTPGMLLSQSLCTWPPGVSSQCRARGALLPDRHKNGKSEWAQVLGISELRWRE